MRGCSDSLTKAKVGKRHEALAMCRRASLMRCDGHKANERVTRLSRTHRRTKAAIEGCSRTREVEPDGFEPTTSALQRRRSTS